MTRCWIPAIAVSLADEELTLDASLVKEEKMLHKWLQRSSSNFECMYKTDIEAMKVTVLLLYGDITLLVAGPTKWARDGAKSSLLTATPTNANLIGGGVQLYDVMCF